jgi:hypothetical protein
MEVELQFKATEEEGTELLLKKLAGILSQNAPVSDRAA